MVWSRRKNASGRITAKTADIITGTIADRKISRRC
jgi:hypothetical protein